MSEDPLHERMERHAELRDELADVSREKDAVASEVKDRLADAIAEAIVLEGANVEALEQSRDGTRFRFGARLDRAALVAALMDELPAGFFISHVNDDGSLSVDWTGKDHTPSKREHGSVLKAIVAEETVTDSSSQCPPANAFWRGQSNSVSTRTTPPTASADWRRWTSWTSPTRASIPTRISRCAKPGDPSSPASNRRTPARSYIIVHLVYGECA